MPPRLSYPATRMPVDRVFSLKGIGTVITGTLWSGSLSAEDTVAILPPRGAQGSAANAGGTGAERPGARPRGGGGRWRAARGAEPHRCRSRRGRSGPVGGQRPGHRAHVSGRCAPHAAARRAGSALPRAAGTGGPRHGGDPGQGGAGRPGDPQPGRVLLRPAPFRGAGSGLSGRPFHPALGDPGDHHRGWPGGRPGAA